MIDFAKLKEQEFIIRPAQFANNKITPLGENEVSKEGETLYLIYPAHIGAVWTHENLVYRSSIWTSSGVPVSLSFKKFFNYTEKPSLVPDPEDITKCFVREKIDGSTLIVSKYKGYLITRTRGTFNAYELDNGFELDLLKEMYPKAFDNEYINSEKMSLVFEWVSPANRIVINYGDDPDMFFIAAIKHDNYEYVTQKELSAMSEVIGVKSTPIYTFSDMTELLKTVQAFKGKEGVCVYYNKEQDIKKVKGVEYLALHAFKSQVSAKNMIELFLEYNMPDYTTFMTKIELQFDFECAQMARPYVSKVCDAYRQVKSIKAGMEKFIEPLKTITRKDAAFKILEAYGKTSRSGFVFKLLDGKDFDKEMYKKLLFQGMGESE